jgi:hypothetical protein
LKLCLVNHGIEPTVVSSCIRSSPDEGTARGTCVTPGKDVYFKNCVLEEQARLVTSTMPDVMDFAREELSARSAKGERFAIDPKLLHPEHPEASRAHFAATNRIVAILDELRHPPVL